MLKEFKNFIFKGNVVDLSTGVIIGAAFGGIVTAFTKGIVEPILALAGNGPNPNLPIKLAERMVPLVKEGKPVLKADGTPELVNKVIEMDLGLIIGAVLSFLITAAVVFFVIVKPMNKLMAMTKKSEAEAPPAAPPADIALLTEIRDLLKSGQ